jgi:hypothetical protein
MAFSVKQLLLLILFVGFSIAALMNSERTFMIEIVKLVTFGTLVLMAYGAWAYTGESRAYCAGFLLWGGIYYLFFVVLRSHRLDIGTDTFLLWLGAKLEQGIIIWAVFEKTGHLLLSILFGIFGGWVTLFYYHLRLRVRTSRQNSQNV